MLLRSLVRSARGALPACAGGRWASVLTEQQRAIIRSPKDAFRLPATEVDDALLSLAEAGRHDVVMKAIDDVSSSSSASISPRAMKLGMLSAGARGRSDAMLAIFDRCVGSKTVDRELLMILITGFLSSDRIRNALVLLSEWMELTKPAYLEGVDSANIAAFKRLHLNIQLSTKLDKEGVLKGASEIQDDDVCSASTLRQALSQRGTDVRTILASDFEWTDADKEARVPLAAWTTLLRAYASRGSYGKASQTLTFLHAFHAQASSGLLASEPYGWALWHSSAVLDSVNDTVLLRMCHYYALRTCLRSEDRSTEKVTLLMRGAGMEPDALMQASILVAEGRMDDLAALLSAVVPRLLEAGGDCHYRVARLLVDSSSALCGAGREEMLLDLVAALAADELPPQLLVQVQDQIYGDVITSHLAKGEHAQALEVCALVRRTTVLSPAVFHEVALALSKSGKLFDLACLMEDHGSALRPHQ